MYANLSCSVGTKITIDFKNVIATICTFFNEIGSNTKYCRNKRVSLIQKIQNWYTGLSVALLV